MADTQSILQLGIEAARAGDKAEARELFRLVTREDPNNAQGWLWLAGVAEDREEKRAALERVTQIDPANELARKGLAALGGASAVAATPSPPAPPPPPAPGPANDGDIADAFDSIDSYASAPESTRARIYDNQPEQVGGYVPPDFGDEDYDLSEYQNRPRVSAADVDTGQRNFDPMLVVEDEEPRRKGFPWFPVVIGTLVLAAIVLVLLLVSNFFDRETVASNPGGVTGGVTETVTADASGIGGGIDATTTTTTTGSLDTSASPAPGGLDASPYPAPAGGLDASASPGVEASPSGALDASPSPAVEASPSPVVEAAPSPAPVASPAPATDVATANPAIVGNDQIITAGNWQFGYTGLSNIATGSYGGSLPARGNYLIVLLTVRNTGEAPTQIPDGFFVVKDASGQVYDFNRAASVDYINRFGGTGPRGAGDYAADAQLPPNAPLGSIPLLFDIDPNATNLVIFSRDNTSQGFLVR